MTTDYSKLFNDAQNLKLKQSSDTSTNWNKSNRILFEGEIAYEKDTHNARKVIILNADKPLVRKYIPGVSIKRDKASVTKKEFEDFVKTLGEKGAKTYAL